MGDERPTSTAGLVIYVAAARLVRPVGFKGNEAQAVIDALIRR